MRQIKFRTWDTQNDEYSEWTNRDPFFDTSHSRVFFWERVKKEDGSYGGDILLEDYGNRFILEQFTGLLDLKGKEIYEGDILKLCYKSKHEIWENEEFKGWSKEEKDFFKLYQVGFFNDEFSINCGEYQIQINGWGAKMIYNSDETSSTNELEKENIFPIGDFGAFGVMAKCIEIIGNIHENPNLLSC